MLTIGCGTETNKGKKCLFIRSLDPERTQLGERRSCWQVREIDINGQGTAANAFKCE